MSKPIQTVEELDAVLHWRSKHALAIKERDALQQLLNQRDEQVESLKLQPPGEHVACMPVERCYDVRAKMIIAFNEAKKAGGDLDDALDAAYKSALRYSPNPLSAEQPAPVAVMPQGWQMVPVAPTDDMIVAFSEAWYSKRQAIEDPDMLDAYRDMLTAAPTPPQPIYDEAKELERCRAFWNQGHPLVAFGDLWTGWRARAMAGEDE